MTPLHRIEERLHALTFRQAIGFVVGANLFLVVLALALPADGEMRGPANQPLCQNCAAPSPAVSEQVPSMSC